MASVKISKRTVDAMVPADKRYKIFDTDLTGFGIRVTPNGTKTYFVVYRPNGGGRGVEPVNFTIGKHGPITPDEARRTAERVLRDVREGRDPHAEKEMRREEPTVNELCDLYLVEGYEHKKESTRRTDVSRINAHIRPLLGPKRISAVTSADIEKFQRDVAGGATAVDIKPTAAKARQSNLETAERRRLGDSMARGGRGTATRTVGLLGGIFTFALNQPAWKAYLKVNPVGGVKRYKDRTNERYLSPTEMARLGTVLDESDENEKAIKVILLLAVTGARKSEIEGLKKSEVIFHLSHLQLGDSKTGYKIITLGSVALDILRSIDMDNDSEFVFPAGRGAEGHFVGTYRIWRRIRIKAGIHDVRLHDLRHTFASTGIAAHGSLALLAKILGHQNVKTTQKYAHLADSPVRQAVEETAAATASALRPERVELTENQIDQARRMLSVDIDIEAIARALCVSPDLVRKII